MDSLPKNAYTTEPGIKDNLLPKCILCSKVPSEGIKDGFLLIGQFICSRCEKAILSLAYDDPNYNLMVKKMKNALYRKKRS